MFNTVTQSNRIVSANMRNQPRAAPTLNSLAFSFVNGGQSPLVLAVFSSS